MATKRNLTLGDIDKMTPPGILCTFKLFYGSGYIFEAFDEMGESAFRHEIKDTSMGFIDAFLKSVKECQLKMEHDAAGTTVPPF